MIEEIKNILCIREFILQNKPYDYTGIKSLINYYLL